MEEFQDLRELWEKIFGNFDAMWVNTGAGGSSGGITTGGSSGSGSYNFRSDRLYKSILAYDMWLGKPRGLIQRQNTISLTPETIVRGLELQKNRLEAAIKSGAPTHYALIDWIDLLVIAYSLSPAYRTQYKEFLAYTEELLYQNKDAAPVLENVPKIAQLFLNILRAHQRAEDGDFDGAGHIFDALAEEWMDFDTARQTNILFHSFVHYACLGEWKHSIQIVNRMWAIIRLMDNADRYNYGAWDDWMAVHLVMWFLARFSVDYTTVLANDMGIELTSFLGHKKCLWFKDYDSRFINRLIPKCYYDKARAIIPSLPEWQEDEPAPETPSQ